MIFQKLKLNSDKYFIVKKQLKKEDESFSKPESEVLSQDANIDELEDVIELAGYAYDSNQDIFYSTMNPWQRKVGYCRLYDELSAPLGMIMDCEPIYFEYNNRKWMLSLWKGQYDLVSGGEIGIYTGGRNISIPGIFRGTFYNAVSDPERLQMSYTLKKNGKTMFTREGEHWWLTGFKLGDFAEPSELTMDIEVSFKNETMRDAFLAGFKKIGYKENDFSINGNTVSFIFDTPHTRQPITRTKETDRIIQAKNKLLCELYQEITGPGNNLQEKLQAIKEQSPELYARILKMGKNKKALEVFYIIITIIMTFLPFFIKEKDTNRSFYQKTKKIFSN
jgi:hypothetical protein